MRTRQEGGHLQAKKWNFLETDHADTLNSLDI